MHSTEVVKIIKTLTDEEAQRFLEEELRGRKTARPYKLFSMIRKIHPNYDSNTLKSGKVQKNIWGRLNPTGLAVLRNGLKGKLISFLGKERIKRYGIYSMIPTSYFTIKELFDRGLFDSFETEANRIKKVELSDKSESIKFYYYQYLLNNLFHEFLFFNPKSNLSKINNLDILNYFSIYAILVKLNEYCSLVNINKYQLSQIESSLIENTIAEIDNNNYQRIPSVNIYLTTIKMLTVLNGENYYFDLKKLLTQYENKLSKEELKYIFTISSNYYNDKIQKSSTEKFKEIFFWNKKIYDKKLHGNHPQHIKNIVTSGLKVGEYDWVQRIIEEQKENKQLLFSDLLYDFNMSAFYLYKGNYIEALEYLKKIEGFKIVQTMNHKSLLISIMLDYKTLFIRLLYTKDEVINQNKALNFANFHLSFKKFLQFHKAEINDFSKYINFIDVAHQLYSCKENIGYVPKEKSRTQIQKIEKEINKTTLLHHQSWLLERLAELKERLKMNNHSCYQ